MAKFIFSKSEDGNPYIKLQAEVGEEITADMVLAFANLQQAYSLTEIADTIRGCDNSLLRIAEAIPS